MQVHAWGGRMVKGKANERPGGTGVAVMPDGAGTVEKAAVVAKAACDRERSKADLLTSGHGWSALAKLHKEAGAAADHDAAVSRCMAMSGDDAQLCGQPAERAALN